MNVVKDSTLSNIPKELKELSRWKLWRLETRDGAQTKVPYRTDGLRASPTNPNDWTDFETALRFFDPEKYDGLGFVLTKEDGIVCIDLDGCIGDDGKICDEAMNIVRIFNSWTEISQSGKGLHIFVKGSKPTDKCKAKPIHGEFKAIEIYDDARYIAMTGNHLPGTPLTIEERQGALKAICDLYFQNSESTPAQTVKPNHDSLTDDEITQLSDDEIIDLCFKAKNADKFVALYKNGDTSEYDHDESRAEEGLACIFAFYTKDAAQIERLMNRSALTQREKWIEREDYRRMTIEKAIAYTRERYKPKHNSHEAAAIDHSPNPLEKHPLQPLNGTAQTQTLSGLITRTASERLNSAKKKPPITPLFDTFWLEGELTFMFGATGIGKSILAVQIADAISKGEKIQGFDGPQKPMRVCYFDFELSDRQFLKRYSDENGNVYQFSDNFLTAEIDPNMSIPKGVSFQDYILALIEKTIIEHRIEVAVIDNLSILNSNVTESKDASELMDKLRSLKRRYNISMLVIGHTPKRDISRPLTRNDMKGSMNLINFCDSAFAIGESVRESNVRYLKQIKVRDAECRYDSENVATFKVVKNGSNLCFEHIGFDDEKEHLRDRTDAEMNELEMNILALRRSEPNLSYAEIAERLNTSKAKVGRVVKKEMMRAEKALNRQNDGVYNTPNPF